MTEFVLDASIALAWCFSDESTSSTEKLLDELHEGAAHVPSLWPLEVGNILLVAERKKRISYAGIAQFLALIEKLNINVNHETYGKGFHDIFMLAHLEKLTTYDAAYLELAMRLGIPLASKDQLVCQAAKNNGVEVIS